jgi:hypothetical protein
VASSIRLMRRRDDTTMTDESLRFGLLRRHPRARRLDETASAPASSHHTTPTTQSLPVTRRAASVLLAPRQKQSWKVRKRLTSRGTPSPMRAPLRAESTSIHHPPSTIHHSLAVLLPGTWMVLVVLMEGWKRCTDADAEI